MNRMNILYLALFVFFSVFIAFFFYQQMNLVENYENPSEINPNNPYLKKTIRFTTGHIAYVTNQGFVKYIQNYEIWNSVNIPKEYIQVNIPWNDYWDNHVGVQVPTTPPLISGTFMKLGQSGDNEGLPKPQSVPQSSPMPAPMPSSQPKPQSSPMPAPMPSPQPKPQSSPMPSPQPKPQSSPQPNAPSSFIGGCMGSQYGCCPDGSTLKSDSIGSNCKSATPCAPQSNPNAIFVHNSNYVAYL